MQSFRNQEGKPRQRVILSLGNAPIPEEDRLIIAQRIDLIINGDTQLLDIPLTPSQQSWVDKLCYQIGQRGIKALSDPIPSAESSAAQTELARSTSSECADVENSPLLQAAIKSESDARSSAITLDKVEHSHATSAGAELVGLHAWEQLNLTQALVSCGFNAAQIRCAQATILNRLVDPVSEHALGSWLTQCSSLPDLLGETFEGKHIEGRFYRVADLLHKHGPALETHLRNQQEVLFGRRPTVFLYDLTNTYFEGQAEGNSEALHGHSKEKRNDCPLVSIALAYSQDGLPLGHKVFAGNQNDAKSFPEILARLTTEWSDLCAPGQRALFVMDCGIGTPANCLHLRQHHHDYLVSERRSCRSTYAATFAEHESFTQIEGKTVRVKMQTTAMPPDAPASSSASGTQLAQGEPWEETSLFCRSESRGEKEKAMLAKASERFESDLNKLAQSMKTRHISSVDKIHERLGRLKERHPSVSRYYEINVDCETSSLEKPASSQPLPDMDTSATPSKAGETASNVSPLRAPTSRPTLSWVRKDEASSAESLCGNYCLHSNRRFENAAAMWKLYTDLTHAEDGFRSLKTDLGLRPVHHQTTQRVKAHIFISVLALHLLCYVKKRLAEAAQPARTWTTLKRVLCDHAYVTLTLKTQKATQHVRKLGKPNQAQSAVYKALGVKLEDCPQTRLKVSR